MMADPQSLPEFLLDAGIRVKRYSPGHTEQIRCPKCEGGKTREVSLSVTIDADGNGAVWNCHRGSCGWQDGVRTVRGAPAHEAPRAIQKPRPDSVAVTSEVPDWLFDFFGQREIGMRTIKAFGVYATTRNFPSLGERKTIVFPYTHKGELVNRKFRPFPEKQPQQQDKDALQTLFNFDRLGDAPDEIVWVEGEPDVMALFECEIPNAVSLKDGAPQQATFKEDDKRFEALRTHADVLDKPRRIVLAGDMDGPGKALREELARRLGRHRCWLVDWPEGCKDACDTLRTHGTEAVQVAIKSAYPYPIAGVQKVRRGSLLELRHGKPTPVMSTGAAATDAVMALPTEGRLITVTGIPGNGKTTWTRFVMVHVAGLHERRWAVFSPEMQPWEQFAAQCAEAYHRKPFWPRGGVSGMTDREVMDAETWLMNRVTMLVCDAEDEAPTLDWILERARATVLRDGVTDLLIDPWNEIEQQRKTGETETDFTARALQRLRAFGLRHGCNVWVIVHPAKPVNLKTGEKRSAPGPYDISGSAHWANKSDMGITIHSPDQGLTEVHVWKTRHSRWGKRGNVAVLEFDDLTGCFRTQPGSPPVSHWSNGDA